MTNDKEAYIALVEDDDSNRELISMNLQHAGFEVASFFSVEHLAKTELADYDLLLLDIMLPGKSGIDFARELQASGLHLPVLFVSALSQADSIQKAYEAGAIDYIIKPINIDNLLMKIRNLLFYFVKREQPGMPDRVGEAIIDWNLLKAHRGDQDFKLSLKEVRALMHFVKNPGKVISRKEISEEVWGRDVFVANRSIDNFLVKFRRIFEKDAAQPKIFITYPKQGYAYIKEDS